MIFFQGLSFQTFPHSALLAQLGVNLSSLSFGTLEDHVRSAIPFSREASQQMIATVSQN